MFAEVTEQIHLLILFEPVSFAVFKKLLLPLKSDFLGEGKCITVLCPFLL